MNIDDQAFTIALAPLIETSVNSIRTFIETNFTIKIGGWFYGILAITMSIFVSALYSFLTNKNGKQALLYGLAIGGSASMINVFKNYTTKTQTINYIDLKDKQDEKQ